MTKRTRKEVRAWGIYDTLGEGIWREFEVDLNKTDDLKRKAIAHMRMPYETDEAAKTRFKIVPCKIVYDLT